MHLIYSADFLHLLLNSRLEIVNSHTPIFAGVFSEWKDTMCYFQHLGSGTHLLIWKERCERNLSLKEMPWLCRVSVSIARENFLKANISQFFSSGLRRKWEVNTSLLIKNILEYTVQLQQLLGYFRDSAFKEETFGFILHFSLCGVCCTYLVSFSKRGDAKEVIGSYDLWFVRGKHLKSLYLFLRK